MPDSGIAPLRERNPYAGIAREAWEKLESAYGPPGTLNSGEIGLVKRTLQFLLEVQSTSRKELCEALEILHRRIRNGK